MLSAKQTAGAQSIKRTFSASPDAQSFHCDYTQIVGTANEIVLQFYETVPGLPGEDGRVGSVCLPQRRN